MRRESTRSRSALLFLSGALLTLVGCKSHGDAVDEDTHARALRAVATCNEYTQLIQRCYARQPSAVAIASAQVAALEKQNDAERAQMNDACARDLTRLKAACR